MTTTLKKRTPFAADLPPMLAPNKLVGLDLPLSELSYPYLLSTKYNGIRGLALNGVWTSRSGKPLPLHPILQESFAPILAYAKKHSLVLDGEFNATSANTVGQTRSIMAGKLPTPDDFLYKCFYSIPYSVWNGVTPADMGNLLSWDLPLRHYQQVEQRLCSSAIELATLIEERKPLNIEGFMLVHETAPYLHKRITLAARSFLKYKYYTDPEDAIIIGLSPRRERRPGVLSGRTPFGASQQPYRADAFQETDTAGCIIAQMENGEQIYTPFPFGWTLPERQVAYRNMGSGTEQDIIGEWISFRRLACESRDKPISIKNVEFRDAK